MNIQVVRSVLQHEQLEMVVYFLLPSLRVGPQSQRPISKPISDPRQSLLTWGKMTPPTG